MPLLKTYGRNPTLGEVKKYYAREDVLTFLDYACKKRKVILSFKEEPSLGSEANTPPLEPGNTEHLNQIIAQKIQGNMLGTADDARLHVYPSFHGMTAKDGDTISDFVMEADCQGWRRSFVDVRGAIEILNDFQVPHIAKFSGHRSLHVMIPREAFPDEFEGVSIERAWKNLNNRLRGFFGKYARVRYAHGTGGILRLPYSLNENTGMVSLPIAYENLDDFRPWEAIPHLVEDISPDLFDISADDRDRTSQFLHAALIEKQIEPLKGKMWRIRAKQDLSKFQRLTDDLPFTRSDDPLERAESAWKLMISGEHVPDEIFKGYAQEVSPDVRWFIAEALMGDERAMELLYETDEYAANAIDDSISLTPIPFLNTLLSEATDWRRSLGVTGHLHSIFGRAAGTLRDEIIRQAETVHETKALTLIMCAYALGGAENDWDTASDIAAVLEKRFPGMADTISQDVFLNIKLLESGDWHEERKAEEALIASGERATEALMLAMGSVDQWMRRSVMSILCKIGDPKAAPTLVNALGDTGGKTRRMAMNGILKLKQKPEELKNLLLEAANSDNPRLRANATKALRVIDEAAALEVALKSLEDRDPKVRQAGIKALGKLGGQRAIDALEHALDDENIDATISAAFALSDAEDGGAAVLKAALKSDNVQMARAAAHALVEIGDTSGIDLVIDAFNEDEWQVWCTPFTLGESGHPKALEALLNLVESSLHTEDVPSKVSQAVKALGKCTDRRAVDMLKTVMYTRHDRNSRRSATMALREMGTAESVGILMEALVNNDGNLRQHAGNALMRMGSEILPLLKALEGQTSGKQRRAVTRVLQSVNTKTAISLAESGEAGTVEALMKLVGGFPDEDISPESLQVMKALGNLRDKSAVYLLKTVLNTRRDNDSRQTATMALRQMGTPEAVDLLLEALVSDDEDLGQHAANALAKMGGEVLPNLYTLADKVTGEKHRAVLNVAESISKKYSEN